VISLGNLKARLRESFFFRFLVVGTIGFMVDGGLLQAAIHFFHLSPLWARAPSFSVAVLVTWYLNRNFTFRTPEKKFSESFPAYLASNALGLSLNFSIYSLCVLWNLLPLPALAIASVAALFFNFAMARFVVFGKKK